MTLSTLLLYIGIAAIILTLGIGFWKKGHKTWTMTFLQNFCGVLFIFSGWVKAVDPLGTAYKMEQYFAEFEVTFEGTWFSFLSPMFPVFSENSITFSIVMIIFEIVLGIMLVMGMKTKITSWAFLLLVGFFTFLTGFTYLTGYVPNGSNFFSFSEWGAYKESNMKVTDCGCFGDFIKLVPKTSFFKDVVLLFPALYFVFRHKDMHQLFTKTIRWAILGISTVGLIVYCLSNYKWDIPHADFRPFKIGADVAGQFEAEVNAMSNVRIVAWKLKNKESNKIVELSNDVYMKEYKNYPKTEWEVVDQIKTEPYVVKTKISDFEIESIEGYSGTGDFLENKGYKLMLVSHKMYGEAEKKTRIVKDTVFSADSLDIDGEVSKITNSMDFIKNREEEYYDYVWEKEYLTNFKSKIVPFVNAAKAEGVSSGMIAGGASSDMLLDLKEDTGLDVSYYMADDILLKTIVRSNPGVVLWKDGTIVGKWHINKLPDWSKVSNDFGIK